MPVRYDDQADLVVIGGGAGGLAAALTAGAAGRTALVLEKSPLIGGTSSWSGSLLWTPMNPKGHEVGFKDDREAAINYIFNAMGEPLDRSLVEAYVDHASETLLFLERETPLRFINTPYPDSYVEVPGGVPHGRHLEPSTISVRQLGKWRKLLREPLAFYPFTVKEILANNLIGDTKRAAMRSLHLLLGRRLAQLRLGGAALVTGLMKGCLDKGVRLQVSSKVVDLMMNDRGDVTGVVIEHVGSRKLIHARCGVVLACGGFEWNDELIREYLPIPITLRAGPAHLCAGDNILLARRAGARLAQMDTYAHWPLVVRPGHVDGSEVIGTFCMPERTLPHCIWVNRRGARFVNESSHDCALAFEDRDERGELVNIPTWSIFDGQYRAKYSIMFRVMPGSRDPDWLIKEDSLEALAARLRIDPLALRGTVNRFNEMARKGVDTDFQRGQHVYERTLGDRNAAHPNLGTIERPPFYALPVIAGVVGTRGGAATNAHAQVLSQDGNPIPGFYAAGNAAAYFYWRKHLCGGGTLLPAMTFARQGALHAMARCDERSKGS